jgi:hypothetical protein
MEAAVEVDMSGRVTLRKAVLELLKQSSTNFRAERQISEDAEKQHDRNSIESSESKFKWMFYLNSYSL